MYFLSSKSYIYVRLAHLCRIGKWVGNKDGNSPGKGKSAVCAVRKLVRTATFFGKKNKKRLKNV
jgi:hypothetical protein